MREASASVRLNRVPAIVSKSPTTTPIHSLQPLKLWITMKLWRITSDQSFKCPKLPTNTQMTTSSYHEAKGRFKKLMMTLTSLQFCSLKIMGETIETSTCLRLCRTRHQPTSNSQLGRIIQVESQRQSNAHVAVKRRSMKVSFK